MPSSLLFVQRRAGRAGAQTGLLRLIDAEAAAGRRSVVLLDTEGWLSTEARARGHDVVIEPFPSSRSLAGRLWGNRLWARRVAHRLAERAIDPAIVVGNDHQEALLTRVLAARLDRPSAVVLRSATMSRRDFAKYGCGECELVLAVGPDLLARSSDFAGDRRVYGLRDGLAASDVAEHRSLPASPPAVALVLGHGDPSKGWADLVEAVKRLPPEAAAARMRFDFVEPPTPAEAAASGLVDLDPERFRFLEPGEPLARRLARYDLVIHPARSEPFGFAALVALSAGVPVVSTRVGVLAEAIADERLLVPPGDPTALAAALAGLDAAWGELVRGAGERRARVAADHGIDQAVASFERGLAAIGLARLR